MLKSGSELQDRRVQTHLSAAFWPEPTFRGSTLTLDDHLDLKKKRFVTDVFTLTSSKLELYSILGLPHHGSRRLVTWFFSCYIQVGWKEQNEQIWQIHKIYRTPWKLQPHRGSPSDWTLCWVSQIKVRFDNHIYESRDAHVTAFGTRTSRKLRESKHLLADKSPD